MVDLKKLKHKFFRFGHDKRKYYSFSRVVMYQDIDYFLTKYGINYRSSNILDIGGMENKRKPYCACCKQYITTNINGNPNVFMDAHYLGFINNTFDLVIIDQTLEHVHYPAKVLREAYRVLKNESYIIVGVPMLIPIHAAPYDFWRFTPAGIELLLKKSGFVNISVSSWGHALAVKEYLRYSWKGVPNYQKWKKIINTPNDSTFPIHCWGFGYKS